MSWFRQIKTLYSVTYLLLFYIIWTLLSSIFLSNKLSFNNYLITLGAVLLMEYLYSKEYKKHITLSLPLIAGIIIFWFNNSLYLSILNYVFLVVSIIVMYSDEGSQVNYEEYRRKWITGAYVILPLTLFSILYSPEVLAPMYRLYIVYLILVVISLRESLRYNYNIKSKHSKYINLGMVFFTIIIFQEYTYKVFSHIINKTWVVANLTLEYTLTVIIKVLGYPISYGAQFLSKLLSKSKFNTDGIFNRFEKLVNVNNKNIFDSENFRDEASVVFVMTLLKIMLAITIFIIVIRTLSMLGKVEKRETGYEEFKEKLEDNKKNKQGFISKALKTIFRKRGSVREEILYNYSEFERATEQVEIFKPYMTATQLNNVTKIKVDNVENIDAMTRIYNETKFSNHEVKAESLVVVKKSVNNIKSQLK
jgi:hypothetical protein